MTFLTKAKELLTDRDYKLINPEDLKVSRANIQKRIRAYRDEIMYSNDNEFKKAKSRRIEMLRIIAEELRLLIETIQ